MSLTFLEAYNFMSESEDNVCLRGNGDKYKVTKGDLRFLNTDVTAFVCWEQCSVPIQSLNKSTWSKVEKKKVPETMELTLWGYVDSADRWIAMECAPKERPNSPYRKTDQTRTVTFVEGE